MRMNADITTKNRLYCIYVQEIIFKFRNNIYLRPSAVNIKMISPSPGIFNANSQEIKFTKQIIKYFGNEVTNVIANAK
jgi:hypothetical protein